MRRNREKRPKNPGLPYIQTNKKDEKTGLTLFPDPRVNLKEADRDKARLSH